MLSQRDEIEEEVPLAQMCEVDEGIVRFEPTVVAPCGGTVVFMDACALRLLVHAYMTLYVRDRNANGTQDDE